MPSHMPSHLFHLLGIQLPTALWQNQLGKNQVHELLQGLPCVFFFFSSSFSIEGMILLACRISMPSRLSCILFKQRRSFSTWQVFAVNLMDLQFFKTCPRPEIRDAPSKGPFPWRLLVLPPRTVDVRMSGVATGLQNLVKGQVHLKLKAIGSIPLCFSPVPGASGLLKKL